jgi:HTH-type transcriptional regulator/antitoxin HigA
MQVTTQSAAATPRRTRRRATLPPLRPLRDDAELEAATALAERLAEAEEHGALTPEDADYLEVLLMLIERHEAERFPIRELATPRERLAFLVGQAGMNASDLGRLLGNRALGNKLLRGERELSKTHVRKLAGHFKLNPGYFL